MTELQHVRTVFVDLHELEIRYASYLKQSTDGVTGTMLWGYAHVY